MIRLAGGWRTAAVTTRRTLGRTPIASATISHRATGPRTTAGDVHRVLGLTVGSLTACRIVGVWISVRHIYE